jgi:DNA helicase-2/ATP-dependent DNA helicase PcrA
MMDIEDRIFSIIKSLNPPQQEATTVVNGPVQVIAGAGSGKTRVLTTRIAHLIYSGVEPSEILALTFTNKASKEMTARIGQILNYQVANRIWAGTFHSIFARILRYEAEYLNYPRDFTIYDQEDSNSLIKQIIKDLKLSIMDITPASIHGVISRVKNDMVFVDEYKNIASTSFEKVVAQVYEEYQNRLRENKAMDFDDLLLNTLVLFTQFPDVLKEYQDRFRYILVDEFQDTNRPQYRIIWNLAKAHSNLFVVGDDAQSIYRWRGAEIKNILNFLKDFPAAKQIRLEQNYRSTSTILNAANSLIVNNPNQIKKNLWTNNESGNKIDVIDADDDNTEASLIANKIMQLIKQDIKYSDIAILYRTNAQSLLLERSLRTYNVPYQIFGGLSFYQRKEIKDIIGYLRLLVNKNDSVSLLRVINEPPRGIGKTSLDHIMEYASKNRFSLFDAMSNSNEIQALQARAKITTKNFTETIHRYSEQLEDSTLEDVVPAFLEATGIFQMYKEIDTREMTERWQNIEQLVNDIILFGKDNPNQSISDYLQQISLLTDFDTKEFEGNKIAMMTLHTAKGLEFPVVFIAGMEKGLFPIIRSKNSKEEEEEERRLFYVGITRAEKRLFLTYAKRRARFGEYTYQSPSNFLYEIDINFLNWSDSRKKAPSFSQSPNDFYSKSAKPNFKPNTPKPNIYADKPHSDNYSQISDESTYKLGDIVMHSYFGEGKISAINGQGQSLKLTIDFKSVGRKQIMAAYAKLERFK